MSDEQAEKLAQAVHDLPSCMHPDHRGPYEGCLDCSKVLILAALREVEREAHTTCDCGPSGHRFGDCPAYQTGVEEGWAKCVATVKAQNWLGHGISRDLLAALAFPPDQAKESEKP